jgi:hypothetical protein
MILEKVEITASELDSLTIWFLDSLRIAYPRFTLEQANELFPKLRTKLQLWPNFRVVAWRKPD